MHYKPENKEWFVVDCLRFNFAQATQRTRSRSINLENVRVAMKKQGRKNFLALLRRHPDIAAKHGFCKAQLEAVPNG